MIIKNLISHFFMWRDREDAAAHIPNLRYKNQTKHVLKKFLQLLVRIQQLNTRPMCKIFSKIAINITDHCLYC